MKIELKTDRGIAGAFSAMAVGTLFGVGLALSGMTRPEKVIGFLDVLGDWDPSLMFVMIGAISVHFILYRMIRRRSRPALASSWRIPTKREITPALVIGSLLFGVGWGLAGFCPGPALTSLASLQSGPMIFVGSMVAGMYLFKFVDSKLRIPK